MKKLFNGRFLFILATSIVVLILLTLGAFYLFDDDDSVFIKSGYVLNPLSSTSEKYFFDEKTGYKENLSSMIQFVDVDKNKVSVLKDSFLHYSDESMSFLKKGAILDLDSIKGDKAVSFYNISSESVIEKKDSGYYIDSANGEIKLVNFMGRISDDKYIVVGDLNLKMAGNETVVKGNYFEIVYIEEGIVNIENKDVKFQVASEDAVISIGTKLKIDLGDKKITYDNKDIMSITAITIDGDENIEIVPKVEEDEEEEPQGGENGNGAGTGNGAGDGSGNAGETQTPGNNDGEVITPVDNILVTLKDAKIGSTDIDVVFEILNATDNDSFKLQVVNLSSGRTVDIVASVVNDSLIEVNMLTPNTKYLFMVINERNNTKYFQKILETTGFGIKLEKEYATNNSLSYKISVDDNADISNAKLTLYKFNEETNEKEVVKTCYKELVGEEEKEVCQEKIYNLSSLFDKLSGEHSVLFEGLESDTIYIAVLDEFSVASYNFKDIYNITLNSMTLKEIPTFTEMEVEKNISTGSFDLSLGNIKDPDNAITSYTYMVYDKFTDKLAIEPIVHKNASPLNVLIGEGENKLKNDTNYYYKVIIEYFDNEKYIEYITTDSIVFVMGDDPYVTVTPNPDLITHNTIGATIHLIDNSCLISMPGREKCNGTSNTVIEVSRVNPLTGERIPIYTQQVDFEVTDDDIKYNLYLEKLQPGTTYNIEVRARLNNSSSLDTQELLHTDSSKRNIATKYLSSFTVNWDSYQSNANHVVNAGVKFTSIENTNTETPEETLGKMDKIILKLYQGERPADFTTVAPISTVTLSKKPGLDFKEKFYDAFYELSSSSTFGMSMEQLKQLNSTGVDDPGKLSEYYTLLIEAYVGDNIITLINPSYQYKVSSVLLLDGVIEPTVKVYDITNNMSGNLFPNLGNSGTIVGYNIVAAFDRNSLMISGNTPNKINYYVYDMNNKPLSFYVLNENKELVLTSSLSFNLGEEGYHETNIYMDYGTGYEIADVVMARGNKFKIGFDVELITQEGRREYYPSSKDSSFPRDYGVFDNIDSSKETPSVKMYISKSTADSVIYKYEIKDPDNSLYKDPTDNDYSMFYAVNGGEEHKYSLMPVEDAPYNQFSGEIVINGLRKNDTYKIYYKKNVTKTNSFENDVLPYLDNYSNGDKIFEGYYSPEDVLNNYGFAYKIINDPSKDNKVGIKIVASEEIRKRIVNYQLVFTATYKDSGKPVLDKDGNEAKLVKELWELTDCNDYYKDKQCLYVDYTELKNAGMKSEWDGDNLIEKQIRVSVIAYYDNGLSGYDYKLGNTEDSDYLYCIMQDDLLKITNDSEKVSGSYITFTASGQSVTVWTDTLGAPKGYYTYSINGSILKLTSHLMSTSGKFINVSVNLTGSGYSSKNGYMNPKMISVQEMRHDGASEDAIFSFNSITPKVKVDRKVGIINGTVLTASLSGIDLSEVRIEKNEAGKDAYYLYVETWSIDGYNKAIKEENGTIKCNSTACSGTVRPEVAVPINKDNPLAAIDVFVDGLLANTEYYFQVYIKKKDNETQSGYIYTQLFDAGGSGNNTTKVYLYKTGKPGELFTNVKLGVSVSEEKETYNDKNLNVTIDLDPYGHGINYNFGIYYVLCTIEQAKDQKCGLSSETYLSYDEEGNPIIQNYENILEKAVSQDKVKDDTVDIMNVSDYDLEYGKDYVVYVYASADYYASYERYNVSDRSKINVRLNDKGEVVQCSLRKLLEPDFTVTRVAGSDGTNYYIDFTVLDVIDPDRTLNNGDYYIKLTDKDGKSVIDNSTVKLQVQNASGGFEDVPANTAFNALEDSKVLRVIGLQENTMYSFTIFNDVYINNAGAEEREYEISKSYTVYTTNTYGVSLGNIIYNVNSNSVIMTFSGGSNFDNVIGLMYTIQVADSLSTKPPVSGEYNLLEDFEHGIEIPSGYTDYQFVINPKGMINQLGTTYNISVSIVVDIDGVVDGKGTIKTLSNTEHDSLNGTAVYVENKK